ncbi:MAG: GIY-YIG nuclease family protein [Cyclobacteriaceae bacterium]
MERGGSVYILTNKHNTTLYTGSAVDLLSRIDEHRQRLYQSSFTARYNLFKLVFYKSFTRIEEARELERYIKGKSRSWKIDLITSSNSKWLDLYDNLQ